MTKLIVSVLSALVLSGFSAQAQTHVNGPLYSCSMAGTLKGRSIAFIIGGQVIKGPGEITCVDLKDNTTMVYPVTIKLVGIGFGFELSQIKAMQIVSAGIGVNDPGLFAQSFSLGATAGATLIKAGVSFDLAVRANARNGFGFEFGATGADVEGLGAHIYGMGLEIEGR